MAVSLAAPRGHAHAADGGAAITRSAARTLDLENSLFWLFVAALAWAPFWIGGNDLIVWGVNALLFPGLALAYEISILVRGRPHAIAINQIAVSAALFVAVVAWIFVQNATWTPVSWHHPIWAMAAQTLGGPVPGSISVNRDLSMLAALRLVTAACAFWLALQLCRDEGRALRLVGAVAAIVCGYAAYGLLAYAFTPGYLLWVENQFASDAVTSTFVNRNSFATYAGMGLIAICALVIQFYRQELGGRCHSARHRIASVIDATGRGGIWRLAIAFLTLVALLLTGSRGGITATLLGLFVLGVLSFGKYRSFDQRLVVLAAACLVVVTLLFFGDRYISRLSADGFYDESRMATYIITLRSIFDAPLLGYGYGTFIDVFPMFRDQSVSVVGRWEMAHSTYLEVLQGLGLVFAVALLASVAILILRCLEGSATRQRSATVARVAASVSFLVAAHSLVDFSLQMQGIAITFAALLGAGVAQSASSRQALND